MPPPPSFPSIFLHLELGIETKILYVDHRGMKTIFSFCPPKFSFDLIYVSLILILVGIFIVPLVSFLFFRSVLCAARMSVCEGRQREACAAARAHGAAARRRSRHRC